MKKFTAFICILLCSCSYFGGGRGQLVFHWERSNTGVEKFSRDHSECMREAKAIEIMPDFRSWFYTEETKLNTKADWNASSGIWASYIPYPGAQPLIVNSPVDDVDVNPKEYVACMKEKGYWFRNHTIPEITNINLYKAHTPSLNKPFGRPAHYN